jgi:hypothetical protein
MCVVCLPLIFLLIELETKPVLIWLETSQPSFGVLVITIFSKSAVALEFDKSSTTSPAVSILTVKSSNTEEKPPNFSLSVLDSM